MASVRCVVDSRWSWLVCFCGTFCQIVVMGYVMTFGVLFPVIMEKNNSSRQTTAWIGSIAISLVFFAGPVASALADRFGCRVVSVTGSLLCTGAMVLSSFASQLVHYFFTYSLLFGLGGCFVRVPTFLVTAKYFEQRRSLATGIVSAGAGLGVLCFGPFTQFLLDNLDLANTYRVLAAPCLLMAFAAASYCPLNTETKEAQEQELNITGRKGVSDVGSSDDTIVTRGTTETSLCRGWNVIYCSLCKYPAFAICCLTFVIEVLGYGVPGQHLVKHCQEVGLSPDSAASLFIFIGATSFVTRIASGHVCDVISWLKPLHLYQMSTCILGITTCLFGISRSYAAFVTLSVIFGLCDGVLVSMCNLILLTVVEPKRTAAAFGLANCFMSFSFASGPPLAGLMTDQLGSYAAAFYTGGGLIIFASVLPLLLLCFKTPAPNTPEEEIQLNVESPQDQQTNPSCAPSDQRDD